jgi:hypothetical protein
MLIENLVTSFSNAVVYFLYIMLFYIRECYLHILTLRGTNVESNVDSQYHFTLPTYGEFVKLKGARHPPKQKILHLYYCCLGNVSLARLECGSRTSLRYIYNARELTYASDPQLILRKASLT